MQTGIPSVRRRRLSDGRFRDGGRGRVSYVFLYRKGPASNKRGNNRRLPVEGDSADGVVLRPGVGAGSLKTMKRVYDDSARPIEEELAELASKIPIEEWRKLPKDGSENLDHYIYGAKKL